MNKASFTSASSGWLGVGTRKPKWLAVVWKVALRMSARCCARRPTRSGPTPHRSPWASHPAGMALRRHHIAADRLPASPRDEAHRRRTDHGCADPSPFLHRAPLGLNWQIGRTLLALSEPLQMNAGAHCGTKKSVPSDRLPSPTTFHRRGAVARSRFGDQTYIICRASWLQWPMTPRYSCGLYTRLRGLRIRQQFGQDPAGRRCG